MFSTTQLAALKELKRSAVFRWVMPASVLVEPISGYILYSSQDGWKVFDLSHGERAVSEL